MFANYWERNCDTATKYHSLFSKAKKHDYTKMRYANLYNWEFFIIFVPELIKRSKMIKNPFLTYGYNGPDFFCDRVEETKRLTSLLVNGNHVALMSPRRMGKTGLLRHCFAQQKLQNDYYLFIVDIYATKSLSELIYELGRAILSVLK